MPMVRTVMGEGQGCGNVGEVFLEELREGVVLSGTHQWLSVASAGVGEGHWQWLVRLGRLIRCKSLRAHGASLRDLDFILRPLEMSYESGREGLCVGKMLLAAAQRVQCRADGPALTRRTWMETRAHPERHLGSGI